MVYAKTKFKNININHRTYAKGNTIMNLNKNEVGILRELAKEYSEIASLPIQKERKRLWEDLNRLNMQRPMVNIDQIPWHEMDVDGSLTCKISDPYWHSIEWSLRSTIYKAKHMPADMVVTPHILLPRCISPISFGTKTEEETLSSDSANDVVSHKFVNQFITMDDVEQIKNPIVSVDRAKEEIIRQEASELFKGILPFKMTGICVHLGIWDTITFLMGVENCYFAIVDEPELIHAIMDRFTNAYISMIEQMNEQKLFDTYSNLCHCSYTFSDDLPGGDRGIDNPTSKDSWAFGLAQLFSSASPDVTNEFEVPYMQKLFPYFGAIYYGCCDRLDDRMDIVAKMPNIRKVSCSPWSIREAFAEKMPKNWVMSNKPNPALLVGDIMDMEEARKDLRRTMAAAKANNCNLEIILKDISTVKYQPQRLWDWSRMAVEEAQSY